MDNFKQDNPMLEKLKLDNLPQEEENNQNEQNIWNNKQTTIYDPILVSTNKKEDNSNTNQGYKNDENIINLSSNDSHHPNDILEDFQNDDSPSITNKEDRIELIEKATNVNQNKNFTRKKRVRVWGASSLINKANQEMEKKILYNGQTAIISTSGTSSFRRKKRKNILKDPSFSNIDQKRYRYKIKKIRKIRNYPENSLFPLINKDIKTRENIRLLD